MALNQDQIQKLKNHIENDRTDQAARLMYEWIKTGVASLSDMRKFCQSIKGYAWEDGFRRGDAPNGLS